MIELRTTKDVAIFCLGVTSFSIAASFGSTLFLGKALLLPISPIGYVISSVVPLLVAAPVSYAVGAALRRVTQLKEQLERIAYIDALTDVLNRKGLFDRLRHLEGLGATRQPISLVVLDVDHFKAINDTYGHAVGDLALTDVARVLLRNVREERDFVGRLGGEEFVIAMFGTAAEAVAIAERLRHLVATTPVVVGTGSIAVSASFGVAEWSEDEPIDAALQRADRAMYEAKSSGRNRVVLGQKASGLDSSPRQPLAFRSPNEGHPAMPLSTETKLAPAA